MKLIFLLTLLCCYQTFAQFEDLERILDLQISNREKIQLIKQQDVRGELFNLIASKPGENWKQPSPERIQVANLIGQEVEKRFEKIFDLISSEYINNSYDLTILDILSLSKASESIYNILLEEQTNNPNFTHIRHNLCYDINSLKRRDLEEIKQNFDEADISQLKSLISGYSQFGIPEVERHYAKLLFSLNPPKSPILSKSGNPVDTEFHSYLRVIMMYYHHLGYLPDDVKARVHHLLNIDPKILGRSVPVFLQKALMIENGELKKDSKLRANGLGAVDLKILSNNLPVSEITDISLRENTKTNPITSKSLKKNKTLILIITFLGMLLFGVYIRNSYLKSI